MKNIDKVVIKEINSKLDSEILYKVVELYKNNFNEIYPNLKKDYDRCYTIIKSSLENNSILYIVEYDNEIIGFMLLAKNEIDQIYIKKDFRKYGIGTRLIQISKNKYDHLSLFTLKSNTNAIKFYEKNNFEIIKFGIAPDENVEDVYMIWKK